MVRSVGSCFFRGLGVHFGAFYSKDAHGGLGCGIFGMRGRSRGCKLLQDVVRSRSYPTVICISHAHATTGITAHLRRSNFSTNAFRKGVRAQVGASDRGSFVSGGVQVVITASTFKVKISGGGINLIIRCRVSSSLRGCIRRTNETKHSRSVRTSYCILFGRRSLSGRFCLLGRAGLHVGRVRRI